ncbi:hypothetical protein ACU4GD_13190 [Cupriavidus basilensis]
MVIERHAQRVEIGRRTQRLPGTQPPALPGEQGGQHFEHVGHRLAKAFGEGWRFYVGIHDGSLLGWLVQPV